MLLSGVTAYSTPDWFIRYLAAWLALVAISATILAIGSRRPEVRYVLPLVELVGTTLLVALAGAGSYLGAVYLVIAGGYLLIYPSWLALRLGLAAVACYAVLIPLDPTLFPYTEDTLGVLLLGFGLLVLVLLGTYLSRQVESARSAATAAASARDAERDEARRIDAAMLEATNDFLRCDGIEALADAAEIACARLFPSNAYAVLIADADGVRPLAAAGIDPATLRQLIGLVSGADAVETAAPVEDADALDAASSVGRPPIVPADVARTSETAGDFLMAIRAVGATSETLVVAVRGAMVDPKRRESVATMAGQLVLAYELIAARTALRASARSLAGEAEQLETAVTERTRQLHAAIRDLQVANRAKSEFLANVSHELRTPLTAIVGFSDVLLAGIDGPLRGEQHDDVVTIHRSARRLLELIDDLIDISRIEAGRTELRREAVPLEGLLRQAVEELRAAAGEKGLRMTFAAQDLPDEAWLDPGRLRQIVVNIVGNAVKFTRTGAVRVRAYVAARPPLGDPAGGTPLTEAGPERDAARSPGGDGASVGGAAPAAAAAEAASPSALVVEVVDTGAGIEAADLDRVFEKFQRAAGPDQPGTGLGLSIAREFARLHGGDVTAESTPGVGSRFVITLPLVEPPLAPAGERAAATAGEARRPAGETSRETAVDASQAAAGAAR